MHWRNYERRSEAIASERQAAGGASERRVVCFTAEFLKTEGRYDRLTTSRSFTDTPRSSKTLAGYATNASSSETSISLHHRLSELHDNWKTVLFTAKELAQSWGMSSDQVFTCLT